MPKCGAPEMLHRLQEERGQQQRGDTTWFASTPFPENRSQRRYGVAGTRAEEEEEEKDPSVWSRSLHALLADQPNQAGGVFVNGLVLRGRDLPRLVAVMTPREAEILYVVHPWLGEPVAYM